MDREVISQKIDLVVDRLMALGGADYAKDKMADSGNRFTGLIERDFGIEEWDWPQGLGLYGLIKCLQGKKHNRYMEFLDRWFQRNIALGLPSKNINTTAPYLALLPLSELTGNQIYRQMCTERAEWLMNTLPRTKYEVFQHVTSAFGDRNGVNLHDGEIWVDTLVMAVLFLNQAGCKLGRPEYSQEALYQYLSHIKYLFDRSNSLIHHGWTFHGNNNFGGVYWCRGNAWFTYGIPCLLADSDDSISPGIFRYLVNTWKAQVDTLVSLQDHNGLWHTVLDDPASYCEVSGSSAIAAGILKGIHLGILDSSYLPTAELAISAVCDNIAADGTVLNVSAGTGIGMNADHYKNIVIKPMAYGQSLAILALTEALEG